MTEKLSRQISTSSTNSESNIDFSSDPRVVWAVVEGERLTYGHLFNPTFATETSIIEPLPHQRIAVYEYLLKQPRLRFMLADDAGAGKTIMTGLYIRELLSRRLVNRVLIVPPAGLVGNCCEVTAIDINPVAWFILKCTLEYPQKLAGESLRLIALNFSANVGNRHIPK